MRNCKAYQCGDQMHCGRCGLQWDVNDPDRPDCLTPIDIIRRDNNLRTRKDEHNRPSARRR